MFQNFLKVTIRSLMKSKVFVFINIVGLGLALACCIVAYLNYTYGMTFDRQHEKFEELYQVSMNRDQGGANVPYAFIPLPLGDYIKSEIPSVEKVSRIERSGITIKREDNVFNRTMAFVDEDFMDMFTFEVLYGNSKSYLELSSVLISDQVAISLFGKEDAVGETIEIVRSGSENILLTVGGVFRQPGQKSTLQFQLVSDFENFYRYQGAEKGDWSLFIDGLFVQSKDPSIMQSIPSSMQKYADLQAEARKDFPVSSFWVQTMEEVAFNQRDLNGTSLGNAAMHPQHITAPNIMAILILLLACFNFTNTAIAMSNKRLKEIGVRKTVGGSRGQLAFQFLGENIVLCFLALGIGLLFSLWLVPKYSNMWPNMDVVLSLTQNPGLVIFLVGTLLLTALLAGGYPAIFVSRFKPVSILRGTLKVGSSSILSKILLGLQMMISVLALVSGFGFLQNSSYQDNLDQGYDKEGMIMIPLNDSKEAERYVTQIQGSPMIEDYSLTRSHVGWGAPSGNIKSADMESNISIMDVGLNYVETAGLRVIEGRSFDEQNRQVDRDNNIVINEKMAATFGWEDPIGQQVTFRDSVRYTVVGMVKDFYIYGLWGTIDPTMLRIRHDEELSMVVLKVPEQQVAPTVDFLESVWPEVIPNRPSNILTHERDVLGEAKDVNTNIVQMFLFLAVIAVILSAIGLFTLVSINIQSRTKEIGIRKVLGASVAKITTLVNRPFLIIVLIASFVGGGLGFYMTGALMDTIWSYHIQMNFWSVSVPILMILLIAVLSISGKVIKAARQNPVKSLRYE